MEDLKRGDLVFDSKGRLVGVITELGDDAFLVSRRWTITLPANDFSRFSSGDSGIVTEVIGNFVKVQF